MRCGLAAGAPQGAPGRWFSGCRTCPCRACVKTHGAAHSASIHSVRAYRATIQEGVMFLSLTPAVVQQPGRAATQWRGAAGKQAPRWRRRSSVDAPEESAAAGCVCVAAAPASLPEASGPLSPPGRLHPPDTADGTNCVLGSFPECSCASPTGGGSGGVSVAAAGGSFCLATGCASGVYTRAPS